MQVILRARRIFLISLIFVGFIIVLSFSFNPPNGKTGAPGESFCVECHMPGQTPISGELSINGLPDTLEAGSLVPLQIQIRSGSGTPLRAGLQMVILDTFGNDFGLLLNPGDSSTVQFYEVNNRSYFEHDIKARFFREDSTVTYTVDWELPVDLAGEQAIIYAASMLVNGNGANTGDKMVTFNRSVYVREQTTSLDIAGNMKKSFYLTPNPTAGFLRIHLTGEIPMTSIHLFIFDVFGKRVEKMTLAGVSDVIELELGHLESGIYYIHYSNGSESLIKPFVKI